MSAADVPDEPVEVYLDWNATAPLAEEARLAMDEARRTAWANPSSVHAAGRRARARLDALREALAATLGVHARDVVLTGSGTEANNLALGGAVALALTRTEHPSVVRVAERAEAAGTPVRWLAVSPEGLEEPADVAAALAALPAGATVVVTAVNHETGVLQPVAALAEVARAAGGRLHVDLCQALGRTELAPLLHGDTFAVAAHKLGGPKGIGALAWRGSWAPRPALVGGAQERGLRPGTQDAVAAAGFHAALLRLAMRPEAGSPAAGLEAVAARWRPLAARRDRLEAALVRHGALVNGGGAPRADHVTNVSFLAGAEPASGHGALVGGGGHGALVGGGDGHVPLPGGADGQVARPGGGGWRGDELVAALDLHGVRASAGSACSAGTAEPSPVIEAMLGRARARAALRLSLGEGTDDAAVERVIAVLDQVLGARPSRG